MRDRRQFVCATACGLVLGPYEASAQTPAKLHRIGLFSGLLRSDIAMFADALLGINLKTAKALGLTIPQALLLRADEVIQ